MAAAATIPNNIVDTTVNDAARPMANWNAILTWINANAVHLDGAKAMTGTLSGPAGVDPVSADQYTRKAYVNAQDAAEVTARNAAILASAIAPPRQGARASRVTDQSIPSGVTTAISFNSETWDSHTYFAATSTNIVIPAGLDGIYVVSAFLLAPSSTAFLGEVWVNGSLVFAAGYQGLTVGGTFTTNDGSGIVILGVGDIVTFQVKQSSGSAQNVQGSLSVARLSV